MRPTRVVPALLLAAGSAWLAGCASSRPVGADATVSPADAGVWDELLRPRPEPLPSAPRVTVSEVELLRERPWGLDAPVPASLGLTELVAAGLLRRRDVHFVERRRFSEAADRERRGLSRPAGAPPVGTSPGARYVLTGAWTALGGPSWLDLRLVDAETGEGRAAWRVEAPADADPVGLARLVVGSALVRLDSLAGLPDWSDPRPSASSAAWRGSAIPPAAFAAFMEGLYAEDRYDWEDARRGYQRALDLAGGDFPEADEALARAARLRAGGSLGAS